MRLSLLEYVRATATGPAQSILETALPRLVKNPQAEFCTFSDCGGGVGVTTEKYAKILDENLGEDAKVFAKVAVFEPLPENLIELRNRLHGIANVTVRPVAVGEAAGEATFRIPRRMSGDSGRWSSGTSAVGFLDDGSGQDYEAVPVQVVRLMDEDFVPQFLKLDLQGGELSALKGMGDKIRDVKLIYSEHQFLGSDHHRSLSFLEHSGFLCFFDALQFGFLDWVREIPAEALLKFGIVIDKAYLSEHVPSTCFWGHLNKDAYPYISKDGSFNPDCVKALRALGMSYIQTDLFAVNQRHAASILACL